jgi:hypothetical protein
MAPKWLQAVLNIRTYWQPVAADANTILVGPNPILPIATAVVHISSFELHSILYARLLAPCTQSILTDVTEFGL